MERFPQEKVGTEPGIGQVEVTLQEQCEWREGVLDRTGDQELEADANNFGEVLV